MDEKMQATEAMSPMAMHTTRGRGRAEKLANNEMEKNRKYSIYVLILLMINYLINQCDTFSLIATNESMAQDIHYGERICEPTNQTHPGEFVQLMYADSNLTSDVCTRDNGVIDRCVSDNVSSCAWHYLGQGFEYQLLAGPVYVVLFSISGVPLGLISELRSVNRRTLLVVCSLLWSFMTLLGGAVTRYWHIVITRLLLGIFSAACVPFSVSLIADYFSPEKHGAAMGFFNWGVYLGYSMTYVLLAAERALGWRPVYVIAGAPGIVIALLIVFTVREPPRRQQQPALQVALTPGRTTVGKLSETVSYFCRLDLLLICLAGAVRNGGGIVWAYNIVIFFGVYHPGTRVELWMSWIPVVFGSIGAFAGGYLSDKLSANHGQRGRLMILVTCLLLSAPFLVATLYLPMPWAFVSLMPALLVGEMWIGVCVAAVVRLVPSHLTATAVAVYFCVIQLVGANAGLLVPPLAASLGRRHALLLTVPGLYVVAAAVFALALAATGRRDGRYAPAATPDDDATEKGQTTDA